MTRQNWLLVAVVAILASSVIVTAVLVIRMTGYRSADESAAATPEVEVDSVDGPSIICVLAGGEDAAVYLLDPQDGRQRMVSADDGGFYAYPSWSPDGQHVAYWGAAEMPFIEEEVTRGVWVSSIDVSGHILVSNPITRVLDEPPAWSPDVCKWIAAAIARRGHGPPA